MSVDIGRPRASRSLIPLLAPSSMFLFVALWLLQWFDRAALAPGERLLASLVLAMLYGWPALFAMARSVRAGAFGRAWRPAAIVLSPVAVTLVIAIWGATAPHSTWPGLAIGLWLFAQLLVVPMCWAAARMDFERRRERQKPAA